MNKITITLSILLLAGCGGEEVVQPSPEELLIEEAKAAVWGQLGDPSSAMFGGWDVEENPNGGMTVIGCVNAKNSFGGYVGKKYVLYTTRDNTASILNLGCPEHLSIKP